MEVHVGFYVTRDGRKAQVFSTTMPGKFPVFGVMFQTDTLWSPSKWNKDGSWGDSKSQADLIGEWREDNED